MKKLKSLLFVVTALLFGLQLASSAAPLFKGGENIPADAIVLFDGNNLDKWFGDGNTTPKWKIENGYVEVVPGVGSMYTKDTFGDCQLHIEFWLPLMADAQGQARSNSGVYIMGSYEIQVLDSYDIKSETGDCGAMYSIAPPMVNACRPPENWQTYDIIFQAPKFDANGKKTANARATVLHNGVLIHNNAEFPRTTHGAEYEEPKGPAPLFLQDHGNSVRYRNIWVRRI